MTKGLGQVPISSLIIFDYQVMEERDLIADERFIMTVMGVGKDTRVFLVFFKVAYDTYI